MHIFICGEEDKVDLSGPDALSVLPPAGLPAACWTDSATSSTETHKQSVWPNKGITQAFDWPIV